MARAGRAEGGRILWRGRFALCPGPERFRTGEAAFRPQASPQSDPVLEMTHAGGETVHSVREEGETGAKLGVART